MKGSKFGMLTVLGDDVAPEGLSKSKSSGKWYRCRCECGKVILERGYVLRAGRKKSCGCLRLSINRNKQSNNIDGHQYSCDNAYSMQRYGVCEYFFNLFHWRKK